MLLVSVTLWRNGSASDSRRCDASEGCVFESRQGHGYFLYILFIFYFILCPLTFVQYSYCYVCFSYNLLNMYSELLVPMFGTAQPDLTAA